MNARAAHVPAVSAPRLVREGNAGPEASRGAIESWLDVLVSLLRLPPPERDAIRDELDEHLRERVRDLMLSGRSEPDAVSAAIAELGDAAALARRYHHASHAPRRRFMMHSAIFGLAGAAMVTSLVALRGGTGAQNASVSVFQPTAAAAPAADVRLNCSVDVLWGQLFTDVGQATKTPVFVDWSMLKDLHMPDGSALEPGNAVVGITFRDVPLPRALALINQAVGAPAEDGIDARMQDGVLVISTMAQLDKLEQTLATFDLSALVAARRQSLDQPNYPPDKVLEEATKVIQSLVHPDLWQDNGGDRAQISSFDSRLFVKAPRRIMPQVEWVIGEMNKTATAAADPAARVLTVHSYALANSAAIDVQRAILDRGVDAPVGNAELVVDPSTNSIVVRGTSKEQQAISALLRALDRAPQAAPAGPAR